MLEKIRVGAVSYLNTVPLIYGLQFNPQIELVTAYPGRVADDLLNQNIDLGLVPVAIIPKLSNPYIISDYCIGCNGRVETVCLFSNCKLEEIETVLLDYQSRTSVALIQILFKEYWKQTVKFLPSEPGFENKISGKTAAVVIGDRTFTLRHQCQYSIDLGEAWKQYSGLPFVFAAWVSNRPLSESFIRTFNQANAYGLNHLPEVIQSLPPIQYDLLHYFTQNIQYRLDAPKRQGMSLFLKLLQSLA